MAKNHATPQAPGAVEKLAEWVLAVRASDLPESAVSQAKLLLLDTIGCGFAALGEESARAVLDTATELGGAPQCTVLGGATRTSAPNAVLVNGSLIRILDLNDYVISKGGEIGGHPSDNIPVALAAGELAGQSGREVMAAIVLGYEIFGRFKDLMERDGAWDGVTISGFVAPAMAGRLMRLDQRRLAHAIALSAARAATSTAVRYGSISAAKSLANALVAQNGMQAAVLAQHGVTGPLDILENPRGLRAMFSKAETTAVVAAPLPADSAIMRANIKVYPCIATGQSIAAAAIDLHRQIGGDVDRLQQIRVAMTDLPFLRRQKDDPGRINPTSREAADHSFNFIAAVALIDGEFGLTQFDNERWNDPKVRAMMARIEIVTDPRWNDRAPGSFPCSIHAKSRDGQNYVAEVASPPGLSRHGLNDAAVLQKFEALTASRLDATARQRIVKAVMGLDQSPSCADLMTALAAVRTA